MMKHRQFCKRYTRKQKMKVRIDKDELYPYYVIDKDVVEGYGKEVEISE
jgi:hypothetical protein